MKKKILIALLSLVAIFAGVVALTLTACDKGEESNYTPSLPTEGLSYEYDSETDSYTCTGIGTATATDIVIPANYNGKPVTKIGDYKFESCSSPLTSVTIPDSVTTIGRYAFENCGYLTNITIGSGVTTIGEGAFEGCEKLIEVYNLSSLPIAAGLTYYGGVAEYALNVYTATEGASKLDKRNDGYVFYADGDEVYLMRYDENANVLQLPANYNGKNYEIYFGAFYNNPKITSVIIPDSVTSIGDSAFAYCDSLISVTIDNGVTEIGYLAFGMCASLENVIIGNNVNVIGSYAFQGCISLENVTMGNNVVEIGNAAFYNCTSLESIIIPNNVTGIEEFAFYGCTSLTSVTFVNTTGWKISKNSDMSNSQSAPDLNNPTNNAIYLKSTYNNYYWERG